MCGIAGIFNGIPNNANYLRSCLLPMVKNLNHRGPDAEGSWVDAASGIALGHTRLSIRDRSLAGSQPMVSSDGRFIISYNGELYNTEFLVNELRDLGVSFRGYSDTEVLIEAISAWGVTRTLSRINGMYAFAVWDTYLKNLYLARDPIGIKPLYWARFGKSIVFASELKAIRSHPDFEGVIDRNSIVSLLRHNYIKGPRSIYDNVYNTPPGHLVTIFNDQTIAERSIRSSVDMLIGDPLNDPTFEESSLETIETALLDAMERQITADVSVGTFLSGGVDSSLLTALLSTRSNIKTFTIGFKENDYDEAEIASKVAKCLGTEHHEFYVDADSCRDLIPELGTILDEPLADMSFLPTVILSRMTKRHVGVVLSGDGGDELFAGYSRYLWAMRVLRIFDFIPLSARKRLGHLLQSLPVGGWRRLASVLPIFQKGNRMGERVHKFAELLEQESLESLYQTLLAQWSHPLEGVKSGEDLEGYLTDREILHTARNPLDYMRAYDVMSYLPDNILTKVDRASMSVGLEVRVPFLDDRVVSAAAYLPLKYKANGNLGKIALRKLLGRYLPMKLIDRPKQGFSVPMGEWLRGPLRDWGEDLLSMRKLSSHDLLNPYAVRAVWEDHTSGNSNRQYQLWGPLMLQAWLDAQTSGHKIP